MDALLATTPAATSIGGPGLTHFFCCDPDRALCGRDISGDREDDVAEVDCVVCLDLEDGPCSPTCDYGPGVAS